LACTNGNTTGGMFVEELYDREVLGSFQYLTRRTSLVAARGSLRDPASLPKQRAQRDVMGTQDVRRDPIAALQDSRTAGSDEDQGAAPSIRGAGGNAPDHLGAQCKVRSTVS